MTAPEPSSPETPTSELPTVEGQVRALREDVAALRDLLVAAPRPRTETGRVVSIPEQERIARQLRDDLIRREDEVDDLRKQLLKAQRRLDTLEVERRKLLQSRTWKWGRTAAKVGTAPVTAAKSVYSWLLAVLPGPANQALREVVARARGGTPRHSGMASSRPYGAALPARGGRDNHALVPIPVHGPDGVGAALTAPAVLLVGYGLDATALEELVQEVSQLRRRVDGGLRVLIVTDCDAFHVFRRRSLLFEYIPPRSQWEKGDFAQSYDEFRAARFAELVRVYAPDRIVHVHSADDLRGLPVTLFGSA